MVTAQPPFILLSMQDVMTEGEYFLLRLQILSQDLSRLLDCSASEPHRCTTFGTTMTFGRGLGSVARC